MHNAALQLSERRSPIKTQSVDWRDPTPAVPTDYNEVTQMSVKAMLLIAVSLSAGLAFSTAHAADKPLTAQQQRMGDCNKQATGKSGDERKTFMSACLKGETTPKQTQQEKMTTCNADAKAKSLKGDERKTFMSSCLSGPAAAHPAH